MYHFKNLVFEGGGVKGVAYAGALKELEQRGILRQIRRVGGTSVGSIVAVLLALNCSLEEIEQYLFSVDFNDFMDGGGVIRSFIRMFRLYGLFKGDFFKHWIADIIEKKTGKRHCTFAELKEMGGSRDLYIIGTNYAVESEYIFSYEVCPDMPIADAVRISMSIPFFFAAQRINEKNHCIDDQWVCKDDIFVDGCILNNYPIKLFDLLKYIDIPTSAVRTDYYDRLDHHRKENDPIRHVFNRETLGFRLGTTEQISVFYGKDSPKHKAINSLSNFVMATVTTVLECQQNIHLHSDDWQRTIYIDTLDVKAIDFNITNEKKEELIQSGEQYTKKFFDWYDQEKRY